MANETEAQRWTRRAGDAATEAILAGADPGDVLASVEAGIREGHRVHALRNPTATTPAARPANTAPGSAVAELLRATHAA